MKKIIIVLIFLFVNIPLIFGYGGPPPPLPFLNTEVSGLPYQAPLFFADTNSGTVITQLSFFSPASIDGRVKVEGTYAASNGNNLSWIIPGSSLNFGLSINTGKNWALFIAGKFDDNGANGDLGCSYLFSSVGDVRARLDLGLSSLSMDAKTTFYSYYPDTTYIVKTENVKGWDPFISLTLNTEFDHWIINPYLQLSYCPQTLFDIDWSSEDEVYSSIDVFAITPGLLYRIDEYILLVAGGSYFISKIEGKSTGIFSGFVQTNLMF